MCLGADLLGIIYFLEQGHCKFISLVKFGKFLAAASNIFSVSCSYSPSETFEVLSVRLVTFFFIIQNG